MQTNQYVVDCRIVEHFLEPFHFMVFNAPGSAIVGATINAGDQPGSVYDGLTVIKLGPGKRVFHHRTHIMIAGHAVHGETERQHRFAKVLVGLTAVVLNQVACHRHHVGVPTGSLDMAEHFLK